MSALGERSLLATLDTQKRARDFLRRAVEGDRVSHAYLFVGPPGSGKLDAAWALAQTIVCPKGGCGACEDCVRAARHTHPDVHYYAPESVLGYLVAQVRDVIDDAALTPVRGTAKVYIVTRADALRPESANALLKTLEEPPRGVTFILIATSAEAVLPTIVSRCQLVPFRMVAPLAAADAVQRATGAPRSRAVTAVAIAGTTARAIEFLKSAGRQDARRTMVRALDMLPSSDEWDILKAAKDVVMAAKAPLDELREAQAAMLDQNADYLTRGALKQLEDRNKRELTARERSGIMEVLASARSLMRDVLCRLEGTQGELVNEDASAVVDRLARATTTAGALQALEAIGRAEHMLARNVNPQLTCEVMLLNVRKALLCL